MKPHNHELDVIQAATKRFADKRQALEDLVNTVNCKIEAVYRKNTRALKIAVAQVAEQQAALEALIEASPELFEKPKSLIFHGIKIGFRKGAGGLNWEDDVQVVNLIKKHFPKLADVLIHIEETPIKKALSELPVSDLKRLGVTVEDTGDMVMVKAVDSAVDKAVKQLLKNATEEIKEAA